MRALLALLLAASPVAAQPIAPGGAAGGVEPATSTLQADDQVIVVRGGLPYLVPASSLGGAVTATAATLSGVPTTGVAGTALGSGGTVAWTPSGTSGYVALYTGSADEGARIAAPAGALPTLTPAGAGTYTVRAYAAASGGSALATSPSITVSAGGGGSSYAAITPAGGAVLFALNASAATGHLYADSAGTTQASAGGAVRHIKDKAGGSITFATPTGSFGNTSAGVSSATLVASGQNGLSVLRLAGNTVFAASSNAIAAASLTDHITVLVIAKPGAGSYNVPFGLGLLSAGGGRNLYQWNVNGGSALGLTFGVSGTDVSTVTYSDSGGNTGASWANQSAVTVAEINGTAGGAIALTGRPGLSRANVTSSSTITQTSAGAWDTTLIGAAPLNGHASFLFSGDLYEIVFFSSPAALTTAERNAMIAYAASWAY